jgi:hypothetical protein
LESAIAELIEKTTSEMKDFSASDRILKTKEEVIKNSSGISDQCDTALSK